MPRKKKARPELRVVFDTNILHTQVASDLMKSDAASFIEANSGHEDLLVNWYLPEIVISERRYQMRKRAAELLPGIHKIEKLIGHNLNITTDILNRRVDEAIENQLASLNLSTIALDKQRVDWDKLINSSVERIPPFESGEKEKGFRDSLIAESFFQLVEDSPNTPSTCRLAIVTEDKLLSTCIKEGTKENKNVRTLESLDELESLVNTLVSEVTEDFIDSIRNKVSDFFFEKGKDSSFYYKEEISEKIREKFGEELASKPNKEVIRENGTWWLGVPVFIKKEKQRTFWSTSIKVEAKLYKLEWPSSSNTIIGESATSATGLVMPGTERKGIVSGLLGAEPPKKIEAGAWATKFEVFWSVNITQTLKLTSPTIDEIRLIGSDWDQ